METLADALPKEMARIRDVVMPAHRGIGPASGFAIAFMKRDLELATKAIAEGDTWGMITALKALREYKL